MRAIVSLTTTSAGGAVASRARVDERPSTSVTLKRARRSRACPPAQGIARVAGGARGRGLRCRMPIVLPTPERQRLCRGGGAFTLRAALRDPARITDWKVEPRLRIIALGCGNAVRNVSSDPPEPQLDNDAKVRRHRLSDEASPRPTGMRCRHLRGPRVSRVWSCVSSNRRSGLCCIASRDASGRSGTRPNTMACEDRVTTSKGKAGHRSRTEWIRWQGRAVS